MMEQTLVLDDHVSPVSRLCKKQAASIGKNQNRLPGRAWERVQGTIFYMSSRVLLRFLSESYPREVPSKQRMKSERTNINRLTNPKALKEVLI